MMNIQVPLSCREAAYLSYLNALKEEAYISDTLNQWNTTSNPSEADYRLAQEIAYGTCQRALSLDHFASQLVDKKLKLKRKERALLQTCLYQFYFLERIPLYAITNEAIEIAKKHCHSTFVKFLNAVLRKLPDTTFNLPQGDSTHSLSIRHSYPEFFIEKVITEYGLTAATEILEVGNHPSQTMARERKETTFNKFPNEDISMVLINTKEELIDAKKSSDLYIQNITPAVLLKHATQHLSPPETILDLCSSPGGKIIFAHDLFPNAKLYANDISETKLKNLKENLDKYNIDAKVTCTLGQEYTPEAPLELIILDVPCSNTGVLNKRPEARWRLSEDNNKELEKTQKTLLAHSYDILKDGGHILYMTCSILNSENEKVVNAFVKSHDMELLYSKTILPSDDGFDGGFAALIKKHHQ